MTKNSSQPQSAATYSPEISWEMLDRLDWHLWVIAILLIFVLGAGLLSFMYPAVFWMKEGAAIEAQQRAFFGFCALLGLIQVYLLQKQAKVRRLKRELVEAQAALARSEHESAMQSFKLLPSTDQFKDALAMEFRRASTSGDRLSVVLFTAPSASPKILGVVTRLLRSMLRKGESLYRISDKAVGVVLPRMQASEGTLFAADVEERSRVSSQELEVSVIAYPDDVSSLADLQRKLLGQNHQS